MASSLDHEEPTVQLELQENVTEFGTLTRQLMEVLPGTGKSVIDMQATHEILQKLISRDSNIRHLTTAAVEICLAQRDMICVDEELDHRRQQIQTLQAKLHGAEKIVELAVYRGQQKLEAIECAEKGAMTPEDLIHYAHRISQASSVVSPIGWTPSNPQRPFPRDIEMRYGVLGQLTSGIKPHTQEITGKGETLPPPEKKFALDLLPGMNQNSNNRENGQHQVTLDIMTSSEEGGAISDKSPGGRGAMWNGFTPGVLPESEIMSEDSSPSSDEEVTMS